MDYFCLADRDTPWRVSTMTLFQISSLCHDNCDCIIIKAWTAACCSVIDLKTIMSYEIMTNVKSKVFQRSLRNWNFLIIKSGGILDGG